LNLLNYKTLKWTIDGKVLDYKLRARILYNLSIDIYHGEFYDLLNNLNCTKLYSNKYFVLEAVKQNGRSRQYASEELRNDTDFMYHVSRIIKI